MSKTGEEEVFCSEHRKPFSLSKTGEEESKLLPGSFDKLTAYKKKEFIKIFHESQINRKVKALVLDPGGNLKDYADLYKAQSLGTNLANMLNYWLRKLIQEVADSDGEVVSSKDPLWNFLWYPKAFRRNYRKRSGFVAV